MDGDGMSDVGPIRAFTTYWLYSPRHRRNKTHFAQLEA
jgi:hypothetical protein